MKDIIGKVKVFFMKVFKFIKTACVKKFYNLKDRFSMKQFIVVIATTVFATVFILLANFEHPRSEFFDDMVSLAKRTDATVTEVLVESLEDKTFLQGPDEESLVPITGYRRTITFKAKVTKGPLKGEEVEAAQILHFAFDSWPEDRIKVGKKVVLHDYGDKILFFPNLENLEAAPAKTEGKHTITVVIEDLVHYLKVDDQASIPLSQILVPGKDGYTFEGFYKVSEYTGLADSSKELDSEYYVGEDITIVAAYGQESEYTFYTYNRILNVIKLAIVLMFALIIVGGIKGLTTLLSLGFTCLGIFAVYIPAILSGRNIYVWTLITCFFILIITIFYVVGANKKGYAAIISCGIGILVGALLTVIMRYSLNFTGYKEVREYQLLLYLDTPRAIDLRAILFGAITIGALGAVMDVGISITSALKEVNDQMISPNFRQTVKSGFVIGRDIMGTMANTLLLAYIGTSLILTAFLVSHFDLRTIFAREDVVIELAQILIGSFTLLLTIPLSIFVSAWLFNGLFKNKKE